MTTTSPAPRQVEYIDHRQPPLAFTPWALHLYVSRKPPLLGTVSLGKELEDKVKEKFKDNLAAFWFVAGAAGSKSTYHANLAEFNKWRIIPRMLVDATARKIETVLFGTTYPSPVILAPIGSQAILHQDAELGSVRAAAKVGVPFTMSTFSSRTIEAVAEASGTGPRWFQLYWPLNNNITLSILKRAKENGFTVLVVTIDTMLVGVRPEDAKAVYSPYLHGVGSQVGLSDPVFMATQNAQPLFQVPPFPYDPAANDRLFLDGDDRMRHQVTLAREWGKQVMSGVFRKWEDLKFLRENWDGPLVLKGIHCKEDAELAYASGADGIVVSNHGGRQVNGAVASLSALVDIMQSPVIKAAQAEGKFTILLDSGIRTGSDVIKALALGAQGVLLGRPYVYGLALAGEDGVEAVVRSLLCDLEATLGLMGCRSVADVQGKADRILKRV